MRSKPAPFSAATTLLVTTACLLPSTAQAWGPIGHRTVALLAQHHLSDVARLEVVELLGEETLAEASIWPDTMRSDPSWEHSSPWHWVTVPNGQTYTEAKKNPDGDLLEAIPRFSATLRDPERPAEERRVALRFLVHMVGDLHQPLHVGRGDDRGGNDTEVRWHEIEADLHDVWDDHLIDEMRLSFTELATQLDRASAAEIRAWQADSWLDWASESQALRELVYDLGNGDLGYAYAFRARPVVERRLLQAGIRLAGLLNTIFATPRAPVPELAEPELGEPELGEPELGEP